MHVLGKEAISRWHDRRPMPSVTFGTFTLRQRVLALAIQSVGRAKLVNPSETRNKLTAELATTLHKTRGGSGVSASGIGQSHGH